MAKFSSPGLNDQNPDALRNNMDAAVATQNFLRLCLTPCGKPLAFLACTPLILRRGSASASPPNLIDVNTQWLIL